eukprot:scaffold2398_cov139-Isochrysis_galbana.AAC.4
MSIASQVVLLVLAASNPSQKEQSCGKTMICDPAITSNATLREVAEQSAASTGHLLQMTGVHPAKVTAKGMGWAYEVDMAYSCDALFKHSMKPPERPVQWAALTLEQQQQYTLGGNVRVSNFFLHQQFNGGSTVKWEYYKMKRFDPRLDREWTTSNCVANKGYPNIHQFFCKAFERHAEEVRGKHALVIGSQRPWVETILLAYGVASITTSEYSPIEQKDRRVTVLHPSVVAAKFLAGEAPFRGGFDFAVSYSSIEHSGLGRYGDPINPSGDLEVIQMVRCMLKPDALFFLGFPSNLRFDELVWKAHRVYGPYRLPLASSGFDVVDY